LLQPQGRVFANQVAKHLAQSQIRTFTEIKHRLTAFDPTDEPKLIGFFSRNNVQDVIEQALREPTSYLRESAVFDYNTEEPEISTRQDRKPKEWQNDHS
jgi:hypothetical protein